MPGTSARAVSCRTNVFQAAMKGRGSQVTITVSSMSLTRPASVSVPTTTTSPTPGSPPAGVIVTGWRPGGRSICSTASTRPARSASTSYRWPATSTTTGQYSTCAVRKLRQPRRLTQAR